MSIYITEHANVQRLRAFGGLSVNLPPLRSYSLSSAGSTNPSVGAAFIRVSADAPSLLGILAQSSLPLTSTNSFRIPANAPPELFAINSTAQFLLAAST